jgi:hypothetical protein
LGLGLAGLEVARLWFYYVISAGLALMGIQLAIGWVQMQVLDTLRLRESLVAEDLQGKDARELSVKEISASADLKMKTA